MTTPKQFPTLKTSPPPASVLWPTKFDQLRALAVEDNGGGEERVADEDVPEVIAAGTNTLQEAMMVPAAARKRQNKKGSISASMVPGNVETASLADVDVRSVASGKTVNTRVSHAGPKSVAGGSQRSPDKVAQDPKTVVKNHITALKLTEILRGQASFRAPLYNARRTLDSLGKGGPTAEVVYLRSHLTLVNVALACQPAGLSTLSKDQRDGNIQLLANHGVELPLPVMMTLLELECKLAMTNGEAANVANMMTPWGKAHAFDGKQPKFCDMLPMVPFAEAEAYMEKWEMCVLNSAMLPLIEKGEAKKQELATLVGVLLKSLTADWSTVSETHTAVCVAVTREAAETLELLDVIVGGGRGLQESLMDKVRDFLSNSVKRSIFKRIVREELSQAPFYKNLVHQWQQRMDGIARYAKPIQEATSEAAKFTSLPTQELPAKLAIIAGTYPTWRVQVPVEATAELTQLLLTTYQHIVEKLSDKDRVYNKLCSKNFSLFGIDEEKKASNPNNIFGRTGHLKSVSRLFFQQH